MLALSKPKLLIASSISALTLVYKNKEFLSAPHDDIK